jgi:hypothetical protein
VEEGDGKQYNQWWQGQVVNMVGLVKIKCFACIVQQGTCNSSIINSLIEWGNTSKVSNITHLQLLRVNNSWNINVVLTHKFDGYVGILHYCEIENNT